MMVEATETSPIENTVLTASRMFHIRVLVVDDHLSGPARAQLQQKQRS